MGIPHGTPDAALASLLERDAEVEQLRELIAAAATGAGSSAAVVGPAGIGKSSLLDAAGTHAEEAGLSCLTARGGELEQDFSFGIARQLFEAKVRAADDSGRAQLLDGAAALAARTIGLEAAISEPTADAGFAVLHGLYWLCVNLSEVQPLALIVDDLHWADAASLRFLNYLGRRVEELPVILLMATRPAITSANAELIEQVAGARETVRLSLSPLSEAAIEELLAKQTGQAPDAGFVAACHEASAGNPFLCVSITSALADRQELPDASSVERLTELAQGELSSIVVSRLGRLSQPADELAKAISILGTDAELRYAAELAGLSLAEASAAADSLIEHELVRAGERLDFAHPLIGTSVREQIPPGQRGQLHFRAARILSDGGAAPERIAPHLIAAPEAGDEWIAQMLRDAADAVASKGDPEAAVSYLERALRETSGPALEVEVLRELGMAQLAAGDADGSVLNFERARGLSDDAEERCSLARMLAFALTVPGRYAEGLAVLDEALTELPSAGDLELELEAQLHQGVLMNPGTYTNWKDSATDWVRDVRGRTPGERAYAAVLTTEGMLRAHPAASVREHGRRALEGGLLDDVGSYAPIWLNVAFPLTFAEGFDLVEDAVNTTLDDARRRGSPVGTSRVHSVSSMLRLRQGDIRHAIADARSSIELGRQRGFRFSTIALGTLVEALVEAGELEEAQRELELSEMDGEIPNWFLGGWVLQGRGRLRLAQGRLDEGIADLEELGRRGEQGWWPWNPALFYYRSLLVGALASSDPERARGLASEELELARRLDSPRAVGVALRAVGLAEGGEQGLEHLRESVSVLADSGARLEHARSLVELGAAIRRAGRRRDAREPLQTGMEAAQRCCANALVERALVELRATGARPRRVMRTGVEALTPSELRVAEMAASGMTNREIAQALFVTLRTVQVHLSHCYQKLEIDAREQLSDALA